MFTRSDRLRPNTIFSRLSGTESDKSSVDDFDMERGIVRMRVGLSYDLLRLSPCSGDLYDKPQNKKCAASNRPHPPKQTKPQNQIKQSPKPILYIFHHFYGPPLYYFFLARSTLWASSLCGKMFLWASSLKVINN